MNMKKIVAGAATGGVVGFAALGLGVGLAQADPPGGPCPGAGPGTNFAGPGTPHPPGLDCLPPPGHRGEGPDVDDLRLPMPDNDDFPGFVPDRDDFGMAPWWVLTPPPPPVWAPPPPPPPFWAPGLPVIWNPELAVWGVWQGGVFIQL